LNEALTLDTCFQKYTLDDLVKPEVPTLGHTDLNDIHYRFLSSNLLMIF